jgi:hypothetical protein
MMPIVMGHPFRVDLSPATAIDRMEMDGSPPAELAGAEPAAQLPPNP